MNVEKLLNDAVRFHNLTNPDFVIQKSQLESVVMCYLYSKNFNQWDEDECRLFLYLKEKLSQERIYPFICLQNIDGEDKICIHLGVISEL